MGCANVVLELYGVRGFLEDVDAGRQYWREGETVVHSVLDWAATDGFAKIMSEFDLEYGSAMEFRNRFMMQIFAGNRKQ